MRKALAAAMLAVVLVLSIGSAAHADVPPWPPEEPPAPYQPTPFEQGQAVGRVIGFACGLACCFAVPLIGGLALLVISQRKKKSQR